MTTCTGVHVTSRIRLLERHGVESLLDVGGGKTCSIGLVGSWTKDARGRGRCFRNRGVGTWGVGVGGSRGKECAPLVSRPRLWEDNVGVRWRVPGAAVVTEVVVGDPTPTTRAPTPTTSPGG